MEPPMPRTPARRRPFRLWALVKFLQRWHLGPAVRQGPFRGMRYRVRAVHSSFFPKLLGIYERELHPVVEGIARRGFGTLINVGAAEGYYAVGLALRLPQCRVVAYEMDSAGRLQIRRLAEENDVAGRIEIRGPCEPADLRQALAAADGEAVVLCDVEGYELHLLDPAAVPELRRAWVLVEVHDFVHPGLTELLCRRFAATHMIEQFRALPRSRRDLPGPWRRLLPERYVRRTVGEGRGDEGQGWLWLVPAG
jgi:hypothetical protein